MAFRLLVLHGPNMNLLGQDDIDRQLEARADAGGVELEVVLSHHEGGLLQALHDAREDVDAVLVNPGALAPQAWALAEGLRLVGLPAVEVLLTSLPAERGPSALTGVVQAQVHGKGARGYLEAFEQLTAGAPRHEASADEADAKPSPRGKRLGRSGLSPVPTAPARPGKSIGRKAPAPQPAPPSSSGKSIGRGAAPEKASRGEPATLLTRATVQAQITSRLKGTLSAEDLAAWAREQWSALQRDQPCEVGAKETLDTVLLTLMAGAKAGDHVLLAQMAKLDR